MENGNNENQKSKEVIRLDDNQNSNEVSNFERLDLSDEQKKAIQKILVMNDEQISDFMKADTKTKGFSKHFSLPNTVFAISTVVFCLMSIAFISIVKAPMHKRHFEMAHVFEEKMNHEKHFPPRDFHHGPEGKFECPDRKCERMHKDHGKHFHKEHNAPKDRPEESHEHEKTSEHEKENA